MFNSAFKQSLRIGQRRFQSTSTTFLTKRHEASFRKTWLSDPSTYPLIVVMGVAAALVTGVGGSCLLYNPDVQIHPNKRGSIIRE